MDGRRTSESRSRSHDLGGASDIAENVYEIARVLRERYRDFNHYNRRNPLNEILYIICSLKTDESKYLDTYLSLKRAFPTFERLAAASEEEIAEAIRPGGLYNQKAITIKQLMRAIISRFGKPTLAPLRAMTDEESERFLLSLPGVGKKTARCVMMYSLGRQVFPVDTHCWRIAKRLGWVRLPEGRRDPTLRQKDMDPLQEKIPPELRYSLHVNLVSLGREICVPVRPKCSECPICAYCPKIGVENQTPPSC